MSNSQNRSDTQQQYTTMQKLLNCVLYESLCHCKSNLREINIMAIIFCSIKSCWKQWFSIMGVMWTSHVRDEGHSPQIMENLGFQLFLLHILPITTFKQLSKRRKSHSETRKPNWQSRNRHESKCFGRDVGQSIKIFRGWYTVCYK